MLSQHFSENHGLSVEVLQWPVGFARKVHLIRPNKLVILPYCYVEEDYHPLLAYWRGVHYVNLTWEQLLYPGNEKAKMPRGDFVIKDDHYAWNEQFAESLRKYGVLNNHIFATVSRLIRFMMNPIVFHFKSKGRISSTTFFRSFEKMDFFSRNLQFGRST